MMRSFKKIIATLLLFATILVPAFAAQAESLNAILKYSIYDLYSGQFIQEVNFLTHSSKDASIIQTVEWFNERGIMMDPKRFNLKVSSYLTEYSTSKGNLSAYTADIMVYTTEADVLKNLGIKAETEPGVRNVIEMPQYEPERQMREAWENANNSVPTAITPNAPALETSSESSAAPSANTTTPSQNSASSTSQAGTNEINKPVAVDKASSNETSAKPNENSRGNTTSQNPTSSVASTAKPDESNKPANNQNATDNKVAANQQNNNANQAANKPAANNQQVTVNKTANNNSQSESRSEASQAPVVQKKALPKTGEESNFGWLLALVLVIAGVAVLFGYKKTRKQ